MSARTIHTPLDIPFPFAGNAACKKCESRCQAPPRPRSSPLCACQKGRTLSCALWKMCGPRKTFPESHPHPFPPLPQYTQVPAPSSQSLTTSAATAPGTSGKCPSRRQCPPTYACHKNGIPPAAMLLPVRPAPLNNESPGSNNGREPFSPTHTRCAKGHPSRPRKRPPISEKMSPHRITPRRKTSHKKRKIPPACPSTPHVRPPNQTTDTTVSTAPLSAPSPFDKVSDFALRPSYGRHPPPEVLPSQKSLHDNFFLVPFSVPSSLFPRTTSQNHTYMTLALPSAYDACLATTETEYRPAAGYFAFRQKSGLIYTI